MIFLVLTLALGAQFLQVPTPCEHYLDSSFCHGPGMKPGSVCKWDASEARCVSGKKGTPSIICQSDLPAETCSSLEKCYWDLSAGLCKEIPAGGASVPAGYPASVPKTTRAHRPKTTKAPVSTTPATEPSTYQTPYPNPQPQYPGWPYAYPTMHAIPAYPGYPGGAPVPVYPGYPNAPGFPMPGTQNPLASSNAPVPGYPGYPGQPTSGPIGQECQSLKREMCFGPAKLPGYVCYWDSEDSGECYASLKGDVEALCNQFSDSPKDCDSQLECFYDAQDKECSEVELINAEPVPAYESLCESHVTVDDCASEAACFFEDGICVNLVQARNICGILYHPQLCSTNAGCVWEDGACQISTPRLQQARPVSGNYIVNKSVEGAIYLLAGIMVGILLTFSCTWMCSKRTQNQDLDLDFYSRHKNVV